jgi:meso-butanediol dehydrogenase/(S,S)-butanediol dehydrogenase/diacetyl reductase
MMERFANKVVLITGAASGIGRATAERLAVEGATLALVDMNADGLDQTVQTCRGSGAEVLSIVGDISSESSVAQIIESTVTEFGRIDVLCNIAGILQFKDFRLTTLDDWNKIIGVNLTGTFLMCRDALPHLLESQGNIVNMSSTASLGGHPWTAPYSASKGGIQAMSLGIAVEFGKMGVRCNCVAPGSILTPIQDAFELPEGADPKLLHRIMPLDKMRGPEQIASAVAYLGSDDAAHVNGTVLKVDGGTLA